MRWAKLIESYDYANAGGIACNAGSIYLVGTLTGNNKHIGDDTSITSQYLRSFTSRFDTSGQFKWIRFIGQDNPATELLTGGAGAIAVDGYGYIHNFNVIDSGLLILPAVTSALGSYDLKYDSSGNLLSATKIPCLDSTWIINKVVFSKTDGKYFATLLPNGVYTATSNNAVCAIRPDESLIWMDSTGSYANINGIDYQGGNKIYVCGGGGYPGSFTFGGITTTNTIFPTFYSFATIFSLDTTGIAHWVYNLQGNSGINIFTDISIMPSGKLAATGTFGGIGIHGTDTLISTTGETINPFFVITDSSGNTIKLDQLHGSGYYDLGNVISCDQIGNVYLGGQLETDMGATGVSAYVSHGGNTDFYIAKYGYSNCDSISLSTPNIPAKSAIQNINIYPNPANSEITIENAFGNKIQICNIVGQVVYAGNVENIRQTISISNLLTGTYLMQLSDTNSGRTNKIFIKQ